MPLPIWAIPSPGLPLYCQAGVFDGNASEAFVPGVDLSNGLKILIGY